MNLGISSLFSVVTVLCQLPYGVFDGMERANRFNIEVALVFKKDPGLVQHDPPAVKHRAVLLSGVTALWSSEIRVAMTDVWKAFLLTGGFMVEWWNTQTNTHINPSSIIAVGFG